MENGDHASPLTDPLEPCGMNNTLLRGYARDVSVSDCGVRRNTAARHAAREIGSTLQRRRAPTTSGVGPSPSPPAPSLLLPPDRPGSAALIPLPARRSRPSTARPAARATDPGWGSHGGVDTSSAACKASLLQLLDAGASGEEGRRSLGSSLPLRTSGTMSSRGAPDVGPPAVSGPLGTSVPLPERPTSASVRLHLPMRLAEVMRKNALAGLCANGSSVGRPGTAPPGTSGKMNRSPIG